MRPLYPAVLAVFSALMLTACNSEVRYLAYSSLSYNAMLGDISPRYVASVPVSVEQEAREQIQRILTMPPNQPMPDAMPINTARSPAVSGAELPNFMQNIGVMSYRFDYGFDGSCLHLCGDDEVMLSGSGVLLIDINRSVVQLNDIHLTSADNNFSFTIDALTGRLDHSIAAYVTGGELTQADLMRVIQFDSTGNFPFTGYDPNAGEVIAEDIIFEVQSTAPSGAALGFVFASGVPIIN